MVAWKLLFESLAKFFVHATKLEFDFGMASYTGISKIKLDRRSVVE